MYLPLHELPEAQAVPARPRMAGATSLNVVTQQWREPMQERALRLPLSPRLTAIEDEISLRVKQTIRQFPTRVGCTLSANVEPQKRSTDYVRTINSRPAQSSRHSAKSRGSTYSVAGGGTGAHLN